MSFTSTSFTAPRFVHRWSASFLLSTLMAMGAGAAVLINEADPLTINAEDDGQLGGDFLELLRTADTDTLAGVFVIPFGGSDAKSYASYDLSGFDFSNGNLFVIGTYGVPNSDVIIHRDNSLRNPFAPGPDAIVISQGSIAVGTDVADVPSSAILDAVVYKIFPSPLSPASNPGRLQNTLLLNGTQALIERPNTQDSLSRNAAAPGNARETTQYLLAPPTPGTVNTNADTPRLRFGLLGSIDPLQTKTALTEGAADEIILAFLEREGATTNAAVVSLHNFDRSEVRFVSLDRTTEISSIEFPAGENLVAFVIEPADDGWQDGPQTAYFAATASGYSPASGYVTVADQAGDGATGLTIAEVHGYVFGDANGDGATDEKDQFVEIVNTSAATFDLSGYTLQTGGEVRFTFPAGSVLAPGAAAVVFGGVPADKLGTTEAFGTALIFQAESGLKINRRGDVVSLRDGNNVEKAGLVYWPYLGGSNVSGATIGHRFAANSNGQPYSPGTQVTGVNYATAAGPITFAFSAPTVAALSPDGTVSVTLNRPGNTANAVDVVLVNTNPDVAELAQTTITIPAGQAASAPIPLNHNQALAASATAHFRVLSAPGYFNSASNPNDFKVVAAGEGISLDVLGSPLVTQSGASSAILLKLNDPAPTSPLPIQLHLLDGDGLVLGTTSVTLPIGVTQQAIELSSLTARPAGTATIHAIAGAPDSRNVATSFQIVESALASGPFINEFDASPEENGSKFVEIYLSAGTSLAGYSLGVFAADGSLLEALPLDGVTVSAERYAVVQPVNLPAAGALGLYQAPAATITAVTAASLRIDAIAWGQISESLAKALQPQVINGALGAAPALAASLSDGLATAGRQAVPSQPTDFRQSAAWSAHPFPTPGYANSGAAFTGWAASWGLSQGADGDDDGDGLSNLLEFSLGTDPTKPSTASPLTTSWEGNELTLTLTGFSPLAVADSAHLVTELHSSADLVTWTKENTIAPEAVSKTIFAGGVTGLKFFRLQQTLQP